MAAAFPGGDTQLGTANPGDASSPGLARDDNTLTPDRQLAGALAALTEGRPQEVLEQLPAQLDALLLTSASMWAALGRAHQQLEQGDRAEHDYTQATTLLDQTHAQPSPAEATALAMAVTHAGRDDAALALLETAAEQPIADQAVARALGEQLTAAGDRVAAAIDDPTRQAEALCKVGEAQRLQGRFEEALATFDRALALQPQSASALAGRGAALAWLNRGEEALEALTAALAIDDEMPLAHAMLAEQLRLRNDLTAALQALDRAEALGSSNAWLRGTRGQILLAQGDPAGAIAELRAACALENAPWIAYELASAVILAPSPDEANEAIAILDQALAETPEARSLLSAKADLLSAAGRYSEALETVDRYLADNDDDHAHETRAQALLGLDDFLGALQAADELIARNPNSVIARRTRTLALAELNDYKAALQEAEALLALNPASDEAQLIKATILFGMRRLEATVEAAYEQLRLDPTQPLANGLAGLARRRIVPPALHDAVANLRAAHNAEPHNLTWQIELADALDSLGCAPEEVGTLREGVVARIENRELSDYESLAMAGWAALLLGRLEPAVKWINDAILLEPKLPSLRFLSGLTLLGAHRPEVGLDTYAGGVGLVSQIRDSERADAILDEALRDLDFAAARWSTQDQLQQATETARAILVATKEATRGDRRAQEEEEEGERVSPAERR